MNTVSTTLLPTFGCALLAAALVLVALPPRWRGRWRWVLPTGAFACALVEVGGLSIAESVRGVVGDLSLTTSVGLTAAILHRLDLRTIPAAELEAAAWALLCCGAVFYPLALGIGRFDPYGLGFLHFEFVTILLVVLIPLIIWRQYWLGTVVLLAVAAFTFHLMDSQNLWDYLTDPIAFGFAIVYVVRRHLHRLKPPGHPQRTSNYGDTGI